MKIPTVENFGQTLGAVKVSEPVPVVSDRGSNWQRVMERVFTNLGAQELQVDLGKLQSAIVRGVKFSPQDLIVYQIKASEFGLRVELVTKLSEALMTCMRRFQNTQ